MPFGFRNRDISALMSDLTPGVATLRKVLPNNCEDVDEAIVDYMGGLLDDEDVSKEVR